MRQGNKRTDENKGVEASKIVRAPVTELRVSSAFHKGCCRYQLKVLERGLIPVMEMEM
jgi:hypothetical protein